LIPIPFSFLRKPPPPRAAWPSRESRPEACDLVVVGGGVRALAIAGACAEQGASVVLLAPGEIAGAADERAWPVVRACHADPARMAAQADAPQRLEALARRASRRILHDRTGCLALAGSEEAAAQLARAGERASAAGIAAWMVPAREVAALSPPLAARPSPGPALFEAAATAVDPDGLAFALADAAAAAGAALYADAPVTSLARDGSTVIGVWLGEWFLRAGAVALADDLAAIRLVREGKGRLSLKREERLALASERAAPALGPAIVAGDMTLSRDLAGTIFASGPVEEDEVARQVVALAPALADLRVLATEPVTVWSGVDGRAQVGRADIPGLWLALGFGRDALSLAFAAADHISAALAQGGADDAFAAFAPTRRPTASFELELPG
jgi:glycine/D-amino acid oxidase-like deaminating enzyme